MLRRKYIVILGLSVLSESDNGKEARWTPTTRAGPHCFSFRYPLSLVSFRHVLVHTQIVISTLLVTYTHTCTTPLVVIVLVIKGRTDGAATRHTTDQAGSQLQMARPRAVAHESTRCPLACAHAYARYSRKANALRGAASRARRGRGSSRPLRSRASSIFKLGCSTCGSTSTSFQTTSPASPILRRESDPCALFPEWVKAEIKAMSALSDIKIESPSGSKIVKKMWVPVSKGLGGASLACVLGELGLAYTLTVRLEEDILFKAASVIAMLLLAWLYFMVVKWLVNQEHPQSAAATMAFDSHLIEVPTIGGEGKSAVVVGGGISGLSTAQYLLRSGFSKVVVLEGRDHTGGNNEPYLDPSNNDEHATTCVFTSPSQQPHYAELCRQLSVEQTSHELLTVEGHIILGGKSIPLKMGGRNVFSSTLKQTLWLVPLSELWMGVKIYALLLYSYQLCPESSTSVNELLGERLSKSNVFRDFFMGWVGVNVWCRFNDLDSFPAHAFATFIFEYACPLKSRDTQSTLDACVLDGRLLWALEKDNAKVNMSEVQTYEQHVNTEVVRVRKHAVSGTKHVFAKRRLAPKPRSGVAKAMGLDTLGYETSGYWSGTSTPDIGSTPTTSGDKVAEESADDELISFECDVVILATQPGPGLAIINASAEATTEAESKANLVCPAIPSSLPSQLSKCLPMIEPPHSATSTSAFRPLKPRAFASSSSRFHRWSAMECFTFVHIDDSLAKGEAWVHETVTNATTGTPYQHYAIRPRVGDRSAKFWISYVYGRAHAKDFVANMIDPEKVVEVLTPTLPTFSPENTVERNKTWRAIDSACSDVFWTSCCRSGLQFHNNGILNAKRVVHTIVGNGW